MGSEPGGFFGPLSRIGTALLALVQNRVRLFAVELETEKLRFLDHLVGLVAALGILGMGVLVAVLGLAFFLWQKAGFLGVAGLALVLIATGIGLLVRLRKALENAPHPFEKTLAEFDKDRACCSKES